MFTKSVQHDASHAVHDLIDAGLIVTPIEVPDAEAGKTIEVAVKCWDALAANGFTRSDVVVGVGGGALTDLAGLAEVVKCGLIADPRILELVAKPEEHMEELIERSIRVKAEVVSQDLKESGLREILNYGHTLAHAIEKVEDYTWPHGHAVSVGLVYAAVLGRLTGRRDLVEKTRTLLLELGLPVTYNGDWAALRAAMSVDKKSRGKSLRFVLLDKLARPVTVPIDDEDLLMRAYEDLRA
jgi:3-dehydroquinate synthase